MKTPKTKPAFAGPTGSANTPVMLATMIGALLIKHKVIDGAALDDPEGYDKGHTAKGILLTVHDLLDFLEDRIDESPNAQRERPADGGGQ
jgi:hypothetical protein